ncbi:HET-domain-containing protein [Hypoxylon cercidicola]|nr:HET-domain-containing protein [Hypoxylon cercidicola]
MDIQASADLRELRLLETWRASIPTNDDLDSDSDADDGGYDSTVDWPAAEERKDPEWINIGQVKAWIKICDARHRNHCSTRSGPIKPYWLVNAEKACIVRAPPNADYIALSYVWGAGESCQASSTNIEKLQEEGSLLRTEMPLTLRHVIQLLPLLGESYLWVDRLCIIQDDEIGKQKHIDSMAHIYSNARMTIVVATGEDANYGLCGIRNISQSRISQDDRLFTSHRSTAHQLTRLPDIAETKWYSRGWTLQEIVFSRRTLYFTEGGVDWECHCGTWSEDDVTVRFTSKCSKPVADIFRDSYFPPWPDLHMYLQLVAAYNNRQLTYDNDILKAFAGITTSFSNVFDGGFLFGLPELFLDVALLWKPLKHCRRRVPQTIQKQSPSSLSTGTAFPSWSWIGWQTEVDTLSWMCGYDYVKTISLVSWPGLTFDHILKSVTSYKLISTVKWYVADGLNSPTRPVVKDYETYQGSEDLPSGWSRYSLPFETREEEGYIYKSDRRTRFRFPIPMPCDSTDLPRPQDGPFLYCQTTRAYFYLEKSPTDEIVISLVDRKGQWAGIIRANREKRGSEERKLGGDDPVQLEDVGSTELQEFISISEGNAMNHWDESELFEEWNFPRRSRNTELYEFVHVLWVTRVDGICYRKGVGRVAKGSWLEGNPEAIDATLG